MGIGPTALGTLWVSCDGEPGIETVKPSPLTVCQDEDEVVVLEGEYDGDAPGVVPLVVVVVPGLRFTKRMAVMMPPISTIPPRTNHRMALLRFCG